MTDPRSYDLVKVRSAEEILQTLDETAAVDNLPFMPEMLQYCGHQYRVYKRADKTCDTIEGSGARQMTETVHLAGVRCDGEQHGGCQAGCLIFWKEGWLKRVGPNDSDAAEPLGESSRIRDRLDAGVRQPGSPLAGEDVAYRCQATELRNASTPLPWWRVSQYVRDISSGNATVGRVLRSFCFSTYRKLVEFGVGYRLLVGIYDHIQALRGKPPFPYRSGMLTKTPTGELNLQPGDWVRVKALDEIVATLDSNNRNRGLYFDAEMVRYCGGTYQVLRRVNKILDEKTGKIVTFNNPCIVLRDVYCGGDISKLRLFCPRAIFSYWREIWLEKVDPPVSDPAHIGLSGPKMKKRRQRKLAPDASGDSIT